MHSNFDLAHDHCVYLIYFDLHVVPMIRINLPIYCYCKILLPLTFLRAESRYERFLLYLLTHVPQFQFCKTFAAREWTPARSWVFVSAKHCETLDRNDGIVSRAKLYQKKMIKCDLYFRVIVFNFLKQNKYK